MSFDPDLNAQAQKVAFSRIRINNTSGISLNEKLTFCYYNLVRNVQISARLRKLCFFYIRHSKFQMFTPKS